jgi:acyl-CoA thioesterase-2
MTAADDGDIGGFFRQVRPRLVDDDCFAFDGEVTGRRQFGGITLGQALVAAGQTVEGMAPHLLHMQFLRPHLPGAEVRYQVERLRDGRRFSSRRVRALEGERLLTDATVGFAAEAPGSAYQAAAPAVAPPEELPLFFSSGEPNDGQAPPRRRGFLFEQRLIRWQGPGQDGNNLLEVWARANGEVPDDPLLRAAALAALSDLTSQLMGFEPKSAEQAAASLNHTFWLHSLPRLDGWLLFVRESSIAMGGRVLMTGALYTREGVRCASLAQESLLAGE